MMTQKWNMRKDTVSELFHSTRINRILFLCAVKVQEKPMRELGLKEQTDEVGFFSIRLRSSTSRNENKIETKKQSRRRQMEKTKKFKLLFQHLPSL
jgi:hypothetical protein